MEMGRGVVIAVLRACILCAATAACNEIPCPRDALLCDAVYLPYVVFTFTEADTGESYCGPAGIVYVSPRCGEDGWASCSCVDGYMQSDSHSSMDCHINPPVGEKSDITVEVEGFEPFRTRVSLPFECAPRVDVDVLLER